MQKDMMEELAGGIAKTVQSEGNIRAIFGEPMQLDSHKVIPVASLEIGLGGGGAAAGEAGVGKPDRLAWPAEAIIRRIRKFGYGGGLGGGIKVRPIGFIHEENGQVIYSPIGEDRHTVKAG